LTYCNDLAYFTISVRFYPIKDLDGKDIVVLYISIT